MAVESRESQLQFLMIVDDEAIARYVADHGVRWLFVDLEYLGKDERQGHLDSWKSQQTAPDVSRIRAAAPDAHLLVRINPLYEGSKAEIDDVIHRGADSVMLPMFHSTDDLRRFLDMLAGRAIAHPLVETASALRALPEIAESLPLERLHIGLNDLHLDLGMDFMFEPLTEGLLEVPCAALRRAGIEFGIGGIARVGDGLIPPEQVLGEHVRLGSTATILSRTFHRGAATLGELLAADFAIEVEKLGAAFRAHRATSPEALELNRQSLARAVENVVLARRSLRSVK